MGWSRCRAGGRGEAGRAGVEQGQDSRRSSRGTVAEKGSGRGQIRCKAGTGQGAEQEQRRAGQGAEQMSVSGAGQG